MSQWSTDTSSSSGGVTSVTGTNGVTAAPTTGNVVVSGVNATTSTVGVASFDPANFSVSGAGEVSLIVNSYSLFNQSSQLNSPADSTTYYIPSASNWATSPAVGPAWRLYIPKTGTIRSCFGAISVNGTLGSAENITIAIRVNDTTSTNVTTTARATATWNAFSNNALSIAVTAGDFVQFQAITPAWATNPTNAGLTCTIFIS
jgi:hypothetical protein